MASRRAYADEFAVRVNRAVVLLADRSPADAVLQDELGVEVERAPKKLPHVPTEQEIQAFIGVANDAVTQSQMVNANNPNAYDQ